jgi:spore coat protein U-like protein
VFSAAVSRRSRRLVFVLGLMAAALLSASRAEAQAASCTISTTAVSFGAYNVFNATATDSTGTITFNCNATAANIVITLSKGFSPTFSPRTMKKGAETLSYNLYRNAARSNIWGDGTAGTLTYTNANPPNNSNVMLTIYGRITALQDVSGGGYSDTITAIVNF